MKCKICKRGGLWKDEMDGSTEVKERSFVQDFRVVLCTDCANAVSNGISKLPEFKEWIMSENCLHRFRSGADDILLIDEVLQSFRNLTDAIFKIVKSKEASHESQH